jgi:aryl-alcohol dehydrogenase-like predicted oxidoreductase
MPFFAAVATPSNWDKVEALTEYADGLGWGLLDLALAWVAAQPQSASVLVGATRPEQVTANAAAIDHRLDAGQLAAVTELVA